MHKQRVTLLRKNGRKLKDLEQRPEYFGEVSTHITVSGGGSVHCMTMGSGLPSDNRLKLPPDLYEPMIAQMGGTRWRIRGFESVDGIAYAQEWFIDYPPF